MVAPSCPNCGSTVLPGEAFCDNCGADLTAIPAAPVPAAVSADAPTMLASMPTAAGPAAPMAPGDGALCPVCGQTNLPGEKFCDNCGADLSAPATAAPATLVAAPVAAPVIFPDDAATLAPPPAAPVAVPVVPPTMPDDATILASAPTVVPELPPVPAPEVPPVPAPELPPVPAPELPPVPAPELPPVPAPELPPVPVSAGLDPVVYAAHKAELEAEIGRQQQIIAQFVQMQAMFGATTPPAVTAGLAEAHAALAQAEADLASLSPPTPAVDPEVLRQLEAEIGRQQQIIAQFAQMQAMFGATTPPAVTTGLAEARAALAQAEADMTALTGVVPVTGAPVAPVAPVVTPALAPTPAPSAPTPRLVIGDGGQALNLPTDRAEIIIGREDPVSNIFPEVDLTPFGGEAGGVSRQHAKITRSDGQWMITDLSSTNFTRVDGVRLEAYIDTPLHDGARVQFGKIVTTFHV